MNTITIVSVKSLMNDKHFIFCSKYFYLSTLSSQWSLATIVNLCLKLNSLSCMQIPHIVLLLYQNEAHHLQWTNDKV